MIRKLKQYLSKATQSFTQQKNIGKRIFSAVLALLLTIGTFGGSTVSVHAASNTIHFTPGHNINYGDYFTNRMTFDGDNTAYCVEPMRKTPPAGTYAYKLLSKDSALRKALYYLPGGYGYAANIKEKYLGNWSSDNAYVIGHLVVSYIYAGNSSSTGAFYGAPQNYIDKALEVAKAINSLPAPPDTFKAFIVPTDSGDQTLAGSWYQLPGWIEIKKSSANSDVTNSNDNYSLKGAEYGIYKGDTLIETLVTDANGYAKSGELDPGSYTIKELKNSKGYILDSNSYKVTVTDATVATKNVTEVPQSNPINLLLQKLDQETNENTPQGGATLAGAEFTVKFYDEQSDTDPAATGAKPLRTWVFKTDATGKLEFAKNYLVSGDALYYQTDGKTPCLPLGTVTIQETTAPEGYLLDDAVFVQKITAEGTEESVNHYNTSNVPEQIIRGGFMIQKRDLETKKAEAQGNATLEKAEFTIISLNENPILVDGKTYTKDQVVATLTTNESGVAATKADLLPYGHYRVDEITAPKGYLNEGQTSVEFDIEENEVIVDLTSENSSILNQIIRGDLEFVKVSDGDLSRLANVPFTITSKTTGENHTIVTDVNGYASTSSEWNKHTYNTNQGKTSEDGIWFGTSEPDDSKGALPYDTYTIEEQRCDANMGYDLLKFDVTVYKNSITLDLGTLTDDKIEIGTTALDKETDSHLSNPDEKVTLIDTVEYSGLKKGQEYKLIGTLMDKETGEPIVIDGKEVTAETTFKAKKPSGSVDVTFTFDGSSLKGKTIVVFEDLYYEDLKLAVHADIEDEDQTIFFPEIGTTAKDANTAINISCADEDVTLVDTVTFKNLIPGKEYEVVGTLMDKKTGEPLEVDGKKVTAKNTFTPDSADGAVDVTFTFDGASVKGKTIVAFETLTYDGKELAVHTNINDEGQTIYFPELQTTAKDSDTGSNSAHADEEVTITDTVEYKNLIPGKEYHLVGTIMDKESGEPLVVNEKSVTCEITFTPEESNGSIDMTFTFDASALKGKTIVVFETLLYEDKTVAIHADIEDLAQTIYFPEIQTTAKDGTDEDKEILIGSEVTIIDTVSYKNLTPGVEYKISGVLMDKETGTEVLINDTPITSEITFTPEESSGSVDVAFTFDATALDGHDVVVFEKLFMFNGNIEIEIANHEDINDEGQTVKLTSIPKEPTISTPVKTGDEAPVALYAGIAATMLLLVSGIGFVFFKKRKAISNK